MRVHLKLLLNGLFALPHGSVSKKLSIFGAEATTNLRIKMMVQRYTQQIMLCPNPQQRQVIDFRIDEKGRQSSQLNNDNDVDMNNDNVIKQESMDVVHFIEEKTTNKMYKVRTKRKRKRNKRRRKRREKRKIIIRMNKIWKIKIESIGVEIRN